MSQYTAEKMAEEGKSCEEILQYFFTDVSLKEVTDIVIEKTKRENKLVIFWQKYCQR